MLGTTSKNRMSLLGIGPARSRSRAGVALRLGAVSLMFGLAIVPVAVTAVFYASPAFAGTPCGNAGVPSVAGDSCTYTSPGLDTFMVPTGVTQVMVTAVGGAGGDGLTYTNGDTLATGASGGPGAEVTATVPVTGGSTLYLEVGTDGGPATGDAASSTCSPGAGGTNGGGAGGPGRCDAQSGGGGGGASDLRTSTSAALTGVAGTDPACRRRRRRRRRRRVQLQWRRRRRGRGPVVIGSGAGGSCTFFEDIEPGGTGGVGSGGGAGGTAKCLCGVSRERAGWGGDGRQRWSRRQRGCR